jgi:hypothetical protein
VDAELGALLTLVARVQDLVLGNADGLSLLAASLSLVFALSNFPELKSKLELLGSKQNVDLTNDQVVALWSLVSAAMTRLCHLFLPLCLGLRPR